MPTLNVPQAMFLSMEEKFRAYVGGFGSGKTWVGCGGLAKHFWEHPRVNAGYFAPTYGQIRDIFYPTMDEVAFDWGLQVKVSESNKEVHVYEGSRYRGTVICRSMDKPATIVGFKIGHALVDELDIMPINKAEAAWRKIIARMRYNLPGLRNGVDVATTPEGFRFVYRQFVKELRDKPQLGKLYGLIQASTYDNESNLPDDYIPSLLESYPPQLIAAYLRGQFTNLTSGTVYCNFDRKLNHSDAVARPLEPLAIGMDFNVNKMAAVAYVVREGHPIAVGEITPARDTPDMCQKITQRWDGHPITIYPDASGNAKSSKSASESDFTILRQAGFTVRADPSNPAVRDRILSTQSMLLNAKGERRMKVNTLACPKFTEALEQQAYDETGDPDKTAGFDHVNDAGTYPIVHLYPVARRSLLRVAVGGA